MNWTKFTKFILSAICVWFTWGPASATPLPYGDAYRAWAETKWGPSAVADEAKRATLWGETADPDGDRLPNLLEFATDLDPTRSNPTSDAFVYSIPGAANPALRHAQITTFLRTDDPQLRVSGQVSADDFMWFPSAAEDFTQPAPPNPYVYATETGQILRELRGMVFVDAAPIANDRTAFLRLRISRGAITATSPSVEPFAFTPGQVVRVGATARSNAATIGGYSGPLAVAIPAGARLYVNGTLQTGTTASVAPGDVVWLEATVPLTAGQVRNYTLAIGSQSATWSFTAGSIAAVPDHPGTDSGYTPVETGVSNTGAAQISIPIVVAPGTGGMQPKRSINYSSQGGNGPLGIGFSLSGLSTISRVGRTVAQDGVKGAVKFDANDRFALDDQRLFTICRCQKKPLCSIPRQRVAC